MRHSVYTPGAGHTPPVLAGREPLLHTWQLALNDVVAVGRVRAQDLILVGPRGVGKTVTVSAFAEQAGAQGFEVIALQAVAGHAGVVEALLQRARARIADEVGPWTRARAAFERLDGVNLALGPVGIGVTHRQQHERPTTDAGALAQALATLAAEVRDDSPRGGLLITVDELQVAAGADLALLAAALHRLNVDHAKAPVLFAGTGLLQTAEALRRAGVTHPDRLFVVEDIPLTLPADAARYAVIEPARRAGVTWQPDAADAIVDVSNGYPAHLQLFADAAWTAATGPRHITLDDVRAAVPIAGRQLERRTLGPRWDRITERQMEFLAALALHGGRTSTAAIATTLGRTQQELSWLRKELIEEGDVYAPRRGQLSMTTPMFARYVLASYEAARADAEVELLTLDEMRANSGLPPGHPGHPGHPGDSLESTASPSPLT